MQTKDEIETRLLLEPCHVRSDLGRFEMPIVAIQVFTGGVLAAVEGEAGRVKTGTDPNLGVPGPFILEHELAHGERSRRFIAMDASGNVETTADTGDGPAAGR